MQTLNAFCSNCMLPELNVGKQRVNACEKWNYKLGGGGARKLSYEKISLWEDGRVEEFF